jgi:GT2 family glycosyltransferase
LQLPPCVISSSTVINEGGAKYSYSRCPTLTISGVDYVGGGDQEAILPRKTSQPNCGAFALEGEKDVLIADGAYVALSEEPWLKFASRDTFPRGGFVRICYKIGFAEAPVRPLLRFWLGNDRHRDQILPGPTEGLGVWIGRTPPNFVDVSISPTNRTGGFDFQIVEIRPATLSEIIRRVIFSPKRVFFAISAGWVGLVEEVELNWRWALGAEPLSRYSQWRKSRLGKSVEASDHARLSTQTPRFHIYLDLVKASAEMIDASCRSVASQSYTFWQVVFTGEPADMKAAEQRVRWESQAKFVRAAPIFDDREINIVGRFLAGDTLHRDALACFSKHFMRHSEQSLVYADETREEAAGVMRPVWRPGWSPILQQSGNYLSRSAFYRAQLLSRHKDWAQVPPDDLVDRLALEAKPDGVGSIRRPLFALSGENAKVTREINAVYGGGEPSVSIVIPTRDRQDLLRDCLESLFAKTTYKNFSVVLVDNDSVDPRTHQLIDQFQVAESRFKVLRAPGNFNFSALSNSGASIDASDFLLFLNNDTKVVTPDWIERLLFFARAADVGAVGAKLLYPNGSTQHVGVTLGLGGVAGHFGAGLSEAAPGWMRRNLVPHEVSAVTGACLMVERRKFEAVGRFDAENLPVDLNDIDLCLRLGRRGWRSICNSQVVLIHRQSASRGGGLRLQNVYEKERRFFLERWRAAIRDDPYFHPGLSLYAYEEMLP